MKTMKLLRLAPLAAAALLLSACSTMQIATTNPDVPAGTTDRNQATHDVQALHTMQGVLAPGKERA